MVFGKKSSRAASPAPAAVPFFSSGELDMRGLGRYLWQRRGRILAVTVIVAGITFVVVNVMTPQYRSEARLLLETRQNVFLRADADKNITPTTIDPAAVTSQIQVVLSRDLAHEVIKKLNLANSPEFDPALASSSLRHRLLSLIGIGRNPNTMTKDERTLQAFYDHLDVYAIKNSRVIAVDFSSASPKLAAKVANAVAETYLQLQQVAKQNQTRAAGMWLAGEIEKMRTRVSRAEARVEAYRAKSNLFVGTNNTLLPAQQLTDLNAQIAAARGQQADLEARATQLRALLKSGKLIDSSDISNSATMRRLIDLRMMLRSQLAEQSITLLPRHPRIQELKAQIAEVDQQMRHEGERLARQLENDAAVAGDRVKTLSATLDQVKKTASETNAQDVELRALQREAKTQRDLLESYLVKYREASARDSISAAPPDARIISRATPAISPSYPKKVPMVLIAAFAGFALSSGFTVTGALLSAPESPASYGYGYAPVKYPPTGYRAGKDEPGSMPHTMSPPLEPSNLAIATAPAMAEGAHYGIPAGIQAAPGDVHAAPNKQAGDQIGQLSGADVPLVPASQGEQAPHAPLSPSLVASIEQIAIQLREAGEGGRRVSVIGTERNVGTTSAAIALARKLAEHANVVLVDLAFNAPNLSVISTEPSAPGLAEVIRGQASFGNIITRDQYSRVHLVATGAAGPDGSAFAASPMLTTVIEALVRSYDHVVIDAGSVADCTVERLVALAGRAVLVTTEEGAAPATRVAHERLLGAGFADTSVLVGASAAAAA